jgi:hypothetical protein
MVFFEDPFLSGILPPVKGLVWCGSYKYKFSSARRGGNYFDGMMPWMPSKKNHCR